MRPQTKTDGPTANAGGLAVSPAVPQDAQTTSSRGQTSDLSLTSLTASSVSAPTTLVGDPLGLDQKGPSGSVKVGSTTYDVKDGQVSLNGQKIGHVNDAGDYDVTIGGQNLTGSVNSLPGAIVHAVLSDGASVVNAPSGTATVGGQTYDVRDGRVSLDGQNIGTVNDRGEYNVTIGGKQLTGKIDDLQPLPLGDSITSNGVVSIGTSARNGGAIDSLAVNGKEYINAYDHGRELQMAYSYDLKGEALNPTEAGSSSDGRGDTSSSQLISMSSKNGVLESSVHPAYWLRPGEKTFLTNGLVGTDGTAVNTTLTSTDVLSKKVETNAGGDPNVVKYTTTLTNTDPHQFLSMEAPTGYLASDFKSTYQFDPSTGQTNPMPLDSSQGTSRSEATSAKPIIMATPDGKNAIGVFVPPDPRFKGYVAMSYQGKDAEDSTNKWSLKFAEGDPTLKTTGVPAGDHQFESYMVVGDLETVKKSMAALAKQYPDPTSSKVFDWQYYLAKNPDLAKSGITTQAQAEAHWLAFGIQEGRQGSPSFSAQDYLRAHPEIPNTGPQSNFDAIVSYLRSQS